MLTGTHPQDWTSGLGDLDVDVDIVDLVDLDVDLVDVVDFGAYETLKL